MSDTLPKTDPRTRPRLPITVPVRLHWQGRILRGFTTNVSVDGAFVEMR